MDVGLQMKNGGFVVNGAYNTVEKKENNNSILNL